MSTDRTPNVRLSHNLNTLPAAKIHDVDYNLSMTSPYDSVSVLETSPVGLNFSAAGVTALPAITKSDVQTDAGEIQLPPDEDEILGDFLWDALAGFDSNIEDLTELCM